MTAQSVIQEWCETGKSVYGTSGDLSIAMYGTPAASRKTIIALHGRALTAITWGPVTAGTAYEHVRGLIRRGYAVVAIDAGGLAPWSNPASMTAINNAVDVALARFGGTRVGLLGFSMGGFEALNYVKRHPARVAGSMLWSPCTDLSWAYGLSGYTPSYSSGGVTTQPAFRTEINTAYSCSTGTYLAATSGYRVADEYASWRGLSPIRVVHADDDSTIPVGQARAFVDGVHDPNVTLTDVTSGGHGPWTSIDPADTTEFFDSLTF